MAQGIEFEGMTSGIEGATPTQSAAQSIGPPEGWQPIPGTLEAQVYGKHHTLWAMQKTLENIIPFGKVASQSGRAELEAMTAGEKAVYGGIEGAAVALPFVGKYALRWAGSGLRSGYAKMFPTKAPLQMELMDTLRDAVRIPQFDSPSDILRNKYKLTGPEIRAWESDDLEYFMRRSGATPSDEFAKIFDYKGYKETGKAKFTEGVRNELKLASEPINVQELKWLRDKWDEKVSGILQIPKGSMGDENHKRVLKFMAKDTYGEDVAKAIEIENAPAELYANLLKAMQDPPFQAQLRKLSRAGAGSVLPSMIQPTRVIFGSGNELFGTYKIYEVGKEAHQTFRTSSFVSITQLNQIFAGAGLGKLKVRPTGEMRFKLGKEFKDAYYKAGPAIKQLEDLIRSNAPKADLDLYYGQLDDATRKFVDAYLQWSDVKYLDYFRGKLLQILDESKVTGPGRSKFMELLDNDKDGVFTQLKEAFTPAADVAPYSKNFLLDQQLGRVRDLVDQLINEKNLKSPSEDLMKRLNWYEKKQNHMGLAGYLDTFESVLAEKHATKNRDLQKILATPRTSRYFVQGGDIGGGKLLGVTEETVGDLATMAENKARKLGLDLFFYPEMYKVAEIAKVAPAAYKEYTGHWIFRMLGKPTPVDAKVADWLTSTYGGIERMLGMQTGGIWNAERVRNLSYNINNLVYMGGLGFKPFGALRNMFQPFITVPGDLGGAKDIGYFFKGIARASDKDFREFVKGGTTRSAASIAKYGEESLQAIQEFAPELHLQARATMAGGRHEILGKQFTLPDTQQFRDTAMWMFQMTDRWSRYVASGSALTKWERNLAKFTNPDGTLRATEFMNKMNLHARYKWVREEIEDLIKTGGQANMQKARNLFLKDVIADTQYLYGQAESPLILGRFGAPGRLAVTFQSWWMNYATLLEKWMKTGDAGTKANRLFGFMLTSAIAEQLMEPLWGRGTASQTVGFGPFPGEISEFMIPPTYAPYYRLLAGAISIGKMDWEAASRHGNGFLRSAFMFVPGGLQIQASGKALKKEGWEGLPASFIRYQKATNYEPLWGLMD